MDQARILDLDFWFAAGGANFNLIKTSVDAVGVSAGVGTYISVRLQEHVDGCRRINKPYFTFWIPDPASPYNMTEQSDLYVARYGVKDSACCLDWEPPRDGTRCVTWAELSICAKRVEDRTGKRPLIYTRQNIIAAMGNPAQLLDYKLLIAQYLLSPTYLYTALFKTFEDFLKYRAGQLPPSVSKTQWAAKTIAWQFSKKGIASKYCCSNGSTKENDLYVSTIEKADFLAVLNDSFPVEMSYLSYAVYNNIRSTPGGVKIGSVALGTPLTIFPPEVNAVYEGVNYQWGHIHTPLDGWIALKRL